MDTVGLGLEDLEIHVPSSGAVYMPMSALAVVTLSFGQSLPTLGVLYR